LSASVASATWNALKLNMSFDVGYQFHNRYYIQGNVFRRIRLKYLTREEIPIKFKCLVKVELRKCSLEMPMQYES